MKPGLAPFRAALALVLALMGADLSAAGSPADPAGEGSPVASGVRERVHRDGTARVIVELRLPAGGHVAEGALSSAAAVSVQRGHVANVGGWG